MSFPTTDHQECQVPLCREQVQVHQLTAHSQAGQNPQDQAGKRVQNAKGLHFQAQDKGYGLELWGGPVGGWSGWFGEGNRQSYLVEGEEEGNLVGETHEGVEVIQLGTQLRLPETSNHHQVSPIQTLLHSSITRP